MAQASIRVARGLRNGSLDPHLADVLDTALAAVDAAVVVADAGGRVTLWNAGAEQLFGWSAADALDQLARDLIVPSSRRDEAAEIRLVLGRGVSWAGRFLCRRRDGSALPVQVIDQPILDESGRLVAVVAVCTDVTVHLSSELRAQALQAVADASTDAVFTVEDRRITSWTPAAQRLLGWASNEVVGRSIEMLVPPDRRDEAAFIVDQVERGSSLHDIHTDRLTKGGSRLRVAFDVASIVDETTGAPLAVVTMRDLRSRDEVLAAAHAAEARFRALLARSSELVVIVDADGIVRSTNPSADALAPSAELPTAGRHIGDLVHPEDRILVEEAHGRAVSGAERHPVVVYRRTDAAGEVRWREATLTNLLDDALIGGIVFNVRDVTEREEALDQLRTSEARLRAIIGRSSDVAMFFQPDGTIAWVSPAVREVFGFDPDALVGISSYDLVHPDDRDGVVRRFDSSLPQSGDHIVIQYRLLDAHGRERWVEGAATNLLDDPDVGHIVANLRDITDRRLADDELRRLASFDDLTGLPNRSYLVELIEGWLVGDEAGARCGLVFLDVDDFCDVNDALGHSCGDELLLGISRRISRVLGHGATVARFGGDQFAVFCTGIDAPPDCLAVSEQVRRALDAPFRIGGSELFTAISQGIALGPVRDADTLMSNADTALSRAKKAGRSQTVVFEAAHSTQSAQRLHDAAELRRAIERDEIVPYYQPIVELATGRVVGVEALARWHHPDHGAIAPDEFIPVAESTGLISDLGASILRHACDDAADWARRGRRLQVAVNVSAVQLVDPSLPSVVDAALAASGLSTDRLSIEITETAALADFDAAMVTLNGLRERGIQLSLDDFGTGYSSLALLKRLPVGALKIDRSFVSGLGQGDEDDRIVKGVVGLGLALGFHMVAEGIESRLQADHLRGLGCQFGQGFLWSPAVAPAELLERIDTIESTTLTSL